MIVKSESLFSGLIVNDQRAQCWIGFKNLNQFKAKIAFILSGLRHAVTFDDIFVSRTAKQFTIIQSRQRISFGQTCDLRVLMFGGNDDVISLREGILKAGY